MPGNKTLTILMCAALAAASAACSDGGRKRTKAAAYETDKVQLMVKPGVVLDAELAKTDEARSGAPKDLVALCETCGLLLAYGSDVNGRFSTEGMKMDVDVVWMSHFTIIGISTDLKAPRGSEPFSTSLSPGKATELLILAAGGVNRLGVSQGMNLQLVKR